ncbi:MAG: S41 family peptidase [Rikenellaceae bacterium]
MKKIFVTLLLSVAFLTARAQEDPLWLRRSAISPNGETIAFTYKGDIYTVPTNGGQAKAVTTNPGYDTCPIWSPDSKNIAFASDREGGMDIYIVSAMGGSPKRLTFNSMSEVPIAFADDKTILFSASYQRDALADYFPSRTFSQVYSVSLDASRPVLYSSMPMENISINGGRVLYHDVKGIEDQFRKHHTSSITRDIWLLENGKYTKLTDFKGEDRNPVWAKDGKSFFFLSERDSTFNIYKTTIGGEAQGLTHFKKHPVRYLTLSDNGILSFSYNGELYTMKEGSDPIKVKVSIVTDDLENENQVKFLSSDATDMAVSPSGKEVAFIVRGDVFVTSVDYVTTRRITNTPEQERNIEFSPDGRSLLYSSERNGVWNIYETSIVREEDKSFTYATEIKEKPITTSATSSFQAKYSPDGKEIAYFEDRTTIKVLNLKTNKTRTILEGKFNYSYSDGDQGFQWSPDGKYIATQYIGIGGWNSTDMVIVNVETGEVTNLTESGYSDFNAKWVLDGKAIIWESDRAGYRSHGSWGSTFDVYIKFLDAEAYDKFRLSKEEKELLAKDEDPKEEGKDDKKDKKKDLILDIANHKNRVMRLTINSSQLVDYALSKDGNKLYYLSSFEGEPDLWERDFNEGTTKIIVKGAGYGALLMDKEGENMFMLSDGDMKKIEVASSEITPISFNAQFDYKPEAERQYMFDHVWKTIKDKFYDTNIHGVDWAGYKESYERFLKDVNNNYDFADVLSEMLGELNASHTGARYYSTTYALPTATFGVFYDNNHKGDGLLIKEIVVGSPLSKAGSKIKVGDVIQKIDGVQIKEGVEYFTLLEGKAGKNVELTLSEGNSKKSYTQQVKPISYGQENELLYKRWVEQRRAMVEKLSGGKIGYVHVRAMDSESFREVYSDIIGRYRNYDAMVVDTRHNSGGWLHDDLVTLLSGKEYQRYEPRGQYVGSDPATKWMKPSIVVQCEDNYSNAHGFPFVYKELGIGKLVGAPVPGTMTAVWWENMIDDTIVYGIPQVGVKDMRGNYMENQELEPDILIYNAPEKVLMGEDQQIEAAVSELMKGIKK